MDKNELLKKYEPEDKLLLAHIMDMTETARIKDIPQSSRFLDAHQQSAVERLLSELNIYDYAMDGGFDGAERRVLLLPPSYLSVEELPRPFTAIRAVFAAENKLTHRDFLGSLMGAGIVRETVGDILPGSGSCDILVLNEVKDYLLNGFDSAGRVRLSTSVIELSELIVPQAEVKLIKDTVSSLRLDSVVGAGFSLSREKAANLIRSGKVRLGSMECVKPDKTVAERAVISARGLGKIELEEITGTTKKGRTAIIIKRYI